MTVISKMLFYEKFTDEIQCKHMHFWNESCLKSQVWLSYIVFLGSMKFFLPIYIIKAIINHKKFKDKTFWRDIVIGQVRSASYGVLLANLFLISNCFLCKLSGRLNYYNLGLISGIVSGLAVLIETKENQILDTLIFFNLLVEAVFNNMDQLNIFKLTNTRETILFMAVSSLLMYVLQNREKRVTFTNFWFYTPHIFRKNNDPNSQSIIEEKCEHKRSCTQFALSGIQDYFILGYAFSIVRKIIPKMLTVFRNPFELYSVLINKDNVKFGTFIGAYVGIYRYVICYLLKTKGLNRKYVGAIAGLISGATYSISPNLQVLTVGITTLLQIFYNVILKKLQIKNKLVPQQLVYMMSHSLLIHNIIVCKDTCPTYYINMLNTCTSNMFWKIYQKIIVKYVYE